MADGTESGQYNFKAIEPKWQQYWVENKTFRAEDLSSKPKLYVLDMFPYPSGNGLHVGHPEGYTATDILCRKKRMEGVNVLHPMGWDAFGLPAEQFAVKTGTHPRETTSKNIERFREQIMSLGFSYDWDREVNTTDPKYYRWTQWIFLKLYERGLAYESFENVNWCPELGTVLANEEVVDGKSEVGGYPVEKKPMRQWVLKITSYAERLLTDLDSVDWPESVKAMQRNWIGKSVGAHVTFGVKGHDPIEVFTTRPDTLFGATFVVVAPEHPLVKKATSAEQASEVEAYVKKAQQTSDMERTAADREKTGVFIGAHAINPVNNDAVPIYVADYVLAHYGSGAIMAVPGHDERDHAFAKKYKLPIKRVLTGGEGDIEEAAHSGDGTLVNSDFLDGLGKAEAITKMTSWLEAEGKGKTAVTYKLRDWLFSRQRYWGEPIPICHDKDGQPIPVSEDDLPLILPEIDDFKPSGSGESPLAKAGDWLDCAGADGQTHRRETNTMPQWAGSCWYYLRFIDPDNENAAWDAEKERYWMPVDLYVGGVEHAVLHLLYARFWHKVLYDCGLVSTKEPFQKLVNQGMILGENGEKMSKSRGNVVNPDDVIRDWGADSLRLYEMFMGPLEAVKPWQTNGIGGCHRFLKRVWRLIIAETGEVSSKIHLDTEDGDFDRQLHRLIKKVSEDTDHYRFNTAISAMMEFVNGCYKQPRISKATIETLVKLLSPYAPHMCEELWERLGHKDTLAYLPWPEFDPKLATEESITLSVQVNGKLRGTLMIPRDCAKDAALEQARALDGVQRHLEGKTIAKEIFVPGKIVNFVVKG